jgi:hypothetical protein
VSRFDGRRLLVFAAATGLLVNCVLITRALSHEYFLSACVHFVAIAFFCAALGRLQREPPPPPRPPEGSS